MVSPASGSRRYRSSAAAAAAAAAASAAATTTSQPQQTNRQSRAAQGAERVVSSSKDDRRTNSASLNSSSRNARQKSLRHVRDSTEDLQRQKSTKRKSSPGASSEASLGNRHAQQFRVGNIGNNGLMYLRPVSRSSKQSPHGPITPPHSAGEEDDEEYRNGSRRYTADPSTLPPLPPPPPPLFHARQASAPPKVVLDNVAAQTGRLGERDERIEMSDLNEADAERISAARWRESLLSATGTNVSSHRHSSAILDSYTARPRTPPSPNSRARPRSAVVQSAALQSASKTPERHDGPLKIVIDRASPGRKSGQTHENEFSQGLSLLDVDIPHYRLGAPKFSGRGSAFLQSSINSSNASEVDHHSSDFSRTDFENLFPPPPSTQRPNFSGFRAQSQSSVILRNDQPHLSTSKRSASTDLLSIEMQARGVNGIRRPSGLRYSQPGDGNFVRLSPITGQLVSATPSQLITQITSPSLLDYELMTDFFLTYRSFISPERLIRHLIMRLMWAFGRGDEYGQIIRVRTFVAIRHWILNYFVDDFLNNATLRQEFCQLINGSCADLDSKTYNTHGDLKILGELKRGWRQECYKYWEIPNLDSRLPLDEIVPGGMIGSRDPYAQEETEPRVSQVRPSCFGKQSANPFTEIVSKAYGAPPQNPVQASPAPTHASGSALLPRDSDQSTYYISCSIPATAISKAAKASTKKQGPRPAQQRAVTPKSAAKGPPSAYKPFRHQRSGSFSDSQRDSRTPVSVPHTASSVNVAIQNLPGSLARGAIYQPINAQVEFLAPASPTEERSPFDFVPLDPGDLYDENGHDAVPSSPSVMKFIGSVRRALSIGRQDGSGQRSRSRDRGSRPASAEPAPRPQSASARKANAYTGRQRIGLDKGSVRIDYLSAVVNESFKQAIRDLFEQQSTERQRALSPSSARHKSEMQFPLPDRSVYARIQSDITGGSRSIVIMDGTASQDTPSITQHTPSPPSYSSVRNTDTSTNHNNQSVPVSFDSRTVERKASSSFNESVAQSTSPPEGNTDVIDHAKRQRTTPSPSSARASTKRSPPSRIPVRQTSAGRGRASNSQLRKYASVQRGKTHLSPKVGAQDVELQRISQSTSTSTEDPFSLDRDTTPKSLRRIPGGELKGIDNIKELDSEDGESITVNSIAQAFAVPIRKSSTNALKDIIDPETGERRKSLVLLDTHSSQPMLRASFEKEVAKLADLPDDPDANDIQAALDKLEGRYRPSTEEQNARPDFFPFPAPDVPLPAVPSARQSQRRKSSRKQREGEVVDNQYLQPVPTDSATNTATTTSRASTRASSRTARAGELMSTSKQSLFAQTQSLFEPESVASHDSYNSVPLLERGVSQQPRSRRPTDASRRANLAKQTPKPSIEQMYGANLGQPGLAITSDVAVRDSDVHSAILTQHGGSFYLGDNQSLSSLSSSEDAEVATIAAESLGRRSPTLRSVHDADNVSVPEDIEALPGAIRAGSTTRSTAVSPPPLPPPPKGLEEYREILSASNKTSIRTADRSDSRGTSHGGRKTPNKTRSIPDIRTRAAPITPAPSPATHLPFILAYDSLLLAQQLTLIERDALAEVEWRELIDIQWQQDAQPVRNWVEYLRAAERQASPASRSGVDLCIARFNLVVKWATSSVVLASDIQERALTLSKLIHVAVNARRLRNWATMYQLTTALVSADLSRLKTTWTLVPARDRDSLKYLEALILPMRNFHNLRSEMEASTAKGNFNDASLAGLNGACVPFIGIYTHDLIYNAQKPEFGNPPPGYSGDEMFVNFERHHTAANIVKGLLALIESSSRYAFVAVPEILSKCLWLGALPDDEIAERSRLLEERDSGVNALR